MNEREALVTAKEAMEALDSMDDLARMTVGVDAVGPRDVLRRFISQHGWRPLETAPKDGTRLVVWVPWKREYAFGRYRSKKYGKVSAAGWLMTFMNGYKCHSELEPSHYIPLPAAPKEPT